MNADSAWFASVIGVAVSALGLVWRSAVVTTRVEVTLEQLRGEIARIAMMGDSVARIPLIEQRLTQIESRMNHET